VDRGLIGLLDVRFDGGVRFEDETRRAEAVSAAYNLLGGTITLSPDADSLPSGGSSSEGESSSDGEPLPDDGPLPDGEPRPDGGSSSDGEPLPDDEPLPDGEPRPDGGSSSDGAPLPDGGSLPDAGAGPPAILVDGNRTIEAGGRLEVALDGSRVSGSGGVQTVLAPPGDDLDGGDEDRVPALMERTQRINMRADTVDYDNDSRQVTYGGQVRMWQGNTSFEGETITIDHATGGLSVSGSARTTIQIVRIDEETGESVVSRTDAAAGSFAYDDELRHALYEGAAVLRSDHGDLAAETIEVFLQADGRTLDRLAATGAVQLRLADRWATGESLVYHEAEGRYEMEGTPVEIVEEAEPDDDSAEAEPAAPSEPVCRSTRGLALTFYRGSNVVAVDGRERSRTETASGPCQPLEF